MVSIGVIFGGPEKFLFHDELQLFLRHCAEERKEDSESCWVNIVFQLPGDLITPEFSGVSVGRYSKKDRALMVQVGVEQDWVVSNSRDVVLNYLFDVTNEALGAAKSEFDRRSARYDLNLDRVFLDQWKSSW